VKDGVATFYVFAGNTRIAKITGMDKHYFHKDHLGSSTVLSNASGVTVEATEYRPFGQSRLTLPSSLISPYKYTDQELDAETGLYFYGARYYDPIIGRFISADTVVQNYAKPQALNRYAYCLNNPLVYVDSTGHFSASTFFKAVISGVVGGAVFVLSGGTAAPLLAGIYAGMAAGATSGALSGGGLEGVVKGALIGGALGAVCGGVYSAFGQTGAYVMLAAGAGVATATGGLDGLAYYAGGVLGGVAGYTGAEYAKANWFAGEGVGGPKSGFTAVPGGERPPSDLPELDYHDLLDGEVRITSAYGERNLRSSEFHEGMDFASVGGKWGQSVRAPSQGEIISSSYGSVSFRPAGFPSDSQLWIYHVSLSPSLAGQALPINVNSRTIIANTANIGPSTGPHVHVELRIGTKAYNPSWAFSLSTWGGF
jgi:RHS repeat-associated protein